MYGGQAGGGKSDALCVGPLRWCHLPRFRAVLFRATYDDLERSLGERTQLLYPVAFPGSRYNRSTHTWTFPSGAKVYLRYLGSDDDALTHKSQEYQYIGFDELTTFSRKQYTYLTSRLRSSHGIPIRLRSATNPGDKGHEWVFERFNAWLNPKHPNPAQPGEVRWYRKREGEDQEIACEPHEAGGRARCFIPASLQDNPTLLKNDPGYITRLDDLDPVERARLKNGDWTTRPGRGKYFKRDWVHILTERPRDIVSTVRYWDLAGTEKKSEKSDPDYTAGVKMSLRENGRVLIEHCEWFRGEPFDVERRLLETAQCDGTSVRIGIEQDPGQAGKFQANHYVRLLHGYNVHTFPPSGDKITRFGPFSAQASNKNVDVLAGAWLQEYLPELESFPEGGHDDQCDATSGSYMMLLEARSLLMEALMHLVAEDNEAQA